MPLSASASARARQRYSNEASKTARPRLSNKVGKMAPPAEPARPLERHRKRRLRTLSPARRYVELALALGEQLDWLLLVSLAPWPAPERSREQIVAELDELLADLADVEDASRRSWPHHLA